jgi:hypothetical protein
MAQGGNVRVLLARSLTVTASVAVAGLLLCGWALAGTPPGTPTEIASDVTSALAIQSLPSNLSPPVQSAGGDTAYVTTPSLASCNATGTTINFSRCVFGDTHGTRTMVLWGDSHAFMWFPAVNAVAKAAKWKLVPLLEYGCPVADIAVWNPVTKTPYAACTKFRTNMLAHINKIDPALVIMSEAFTSQAASAGGAYNTITTAQWQTALKKTLTLIHSRGTKKLILGSTIAGPASPSPPQCLAANASTVQLCTVKDTATQQAQRAAEAAAAKAASTSYVNVLPWLCSSTAIPMACSAVIGDATAGYDVVYYSSGHLTETYDLFLRTVLQNALKPHMR